MTTRTTAYPASSVTIGTTSSGNNASGSFTVSSGSNLGLLVLIGTHQGTISACSWNGNALTKIAEGASAFNECGSIWFLLSPTPGTGTLSVTMSGGSWYGWFAVNLSNIKNTATLTNATNTATSSTPSVNITPSSSNNIVFSVAGSEAAFTTGAGLTTLLNQGNQSFEQMGSEYTVQTSAVLQAMNFTLASSQRWGIAAVAIEPFSTSVTSLRSAAGTRTLAGTRTQAT